MPATRDRPSELDRVLRLVGPAMMLEGTMFSILTPLLPHYVSDLGISTGQVGLLSAMFGAGLVVGAVPAGLLATRTSGRWTVVFGFSLLAAASLGFGFAHALQPLIAARFVQGLGAGCIWSGALTWTARLARENTATALGTLIGTAVLGTLLGPPLGALAAGTSTELVFACFAALTLFLALVISRLPADLDTSESEPERGLPRRSLRQAAAAVWLMVLPSGAYGFVLVLSPLRLDAFGAGSFAIAAVFVLAGVMEAGVPPVAGRLADSRGVRTVLVLAAALATATFAGLALADSAILLALMVIVCAGALGAFWTPSSVRVHEAIVALGAREAQAFGVVTLCFAGGQMVGALSSGALAQSLDYRATFSIIAAVFAATVVGLLTTTNLQRARAA